MSLFNSSEFFLEESSLMQPLSINDQRRYTPEIWDETWESAFLKRRFPSFTKKTSIMASGEPFVQLWGPTHVDLHGLTRNGHLKRQKKKMSSKWSSFQGWEFSPTCQVFILSTILAVHWISPVFCLMKLMPKILHQLIRYIVASINHFLVKPIW